MSLHSSKRCVLLLRPPPFEINYAMDRLVPYSSNENDYYSMDVAARHVQEKVEAGKENMGDDQLVR